MISKEKLLRGYVNTKDKEIKKEWYKACEYYGFNMEYCDFEWDRLDASCVSNGAVHFCDFSMITSTKNQLTLSDFKQKKTRTEWVKAEDELWVLENEFKNGELYSKKCNGDYNQIVTLTLLALSLVCKNLYRKVEKEIDWRVEAKDYLDKCKHLTPMCDISLCIAEPKSDDKDDLKEWLELQKESIGLCHLVAELTDKPE